MSHQLSPILARLQGVAVLLIIGLFVVFPALQINAKDNLYHCYSDGKNAFFTTETEIPEPNWISSSSCLIGNPKRYACFKNYQTNEVLYERSNLNLSPHWTLVKIDQCLSMSLASLKQVNGTLIDRAQRSRSRKNTKTEDNICYQNDLMRKRTLRLRDAQGPGKGWRSVDIRNCDYIKLGQSKTVSLSSYSKPMPIRVNSNYINYGGVGGSGPSIWDKFIQSDYYTCYQNDIKEKRILLYEEDLSPGVEWRSTALNDCRQMKLGEEKTIAQLFSESNTPKYSCYQNDIEKIRTLGYQEGSALKGRWHVTVLSDCDGMQFGQTKTFVFSNSLSSVSESSYFCYQNTALKTYGWFLEKDKPEKQWILTDRNSCPRSNGTYLCYKNSLTDDLIYNDYTMGFPWKRAKAVECTGMKVGNLKSKK